MKTVIDEKRPTDSRKITELDGSYRSIDANVPGLIGITLRPHQCVVVAALIDLERRRRIEYSNGEFAISSAIVLSEPFGTGKTFEIIAMVLLEPIPVAMPEYAFAQRSLPGAGTINTTFVVERKFTGAHALIRPNLIVVGRSVLLQWERTITEYAPQLRVLTIAHYHDLKRFQALYGSGRVNEYDIVLLKNGQVAGRLALGDDVNVRDYHSLVAVIGVITADKCWSRVFYDDFDTINILAGTCALNALSTVYVSATRKETYARKSPPGPTFNEHLAHMFKRQLSAVTDDSILFDSFNVRNTAAFVEASTHVTKMNAHKYIYVNPDDNFIRLIGAIGDEEANGIMEALNGDAPGAAAAQLGMKSHSVVDIFKRVLQGKYDDFIAASRALANCEHALALARTLSPHPKLKNHPVARLAKIRTALTRGEIGAGTLKYSSGVLTTYLQDTAREFGERKAATGAAIHRVIDNAKEGMCQICCLPLESMDTFIVKCCGIILCDQCGIKGNQMRKQFDRKDRKTVVIGKCANCQAPVNPTTDLIFLDRNFSLESLMQARGDEPEATPEPEPAPEPRAHQSEYDSIKNPKLRALLAIVRGEVPESREPLSLHIDRLLEGTIDAPPDESRHDRRRVVVFASYNETLHKIEDMLQTHGVTHHRLHGTHREMADTVDKFRAGAFTVLLINSQQHCAGLNLEFCNHMVLFHYITNQNVIGQVVARCQRMMRTENLQLHLLCYQNEEAFIKRYGYVD